LGKPGGGSGEAAFDGRYIIACIFHTPLLRSRHAGILLMVIQYLVLGRYIFRITVLSYRKLQLH
jgi:hypothetical protein